MPAFDLGFLDAEFARLGASAPLAPRLNCVRCSIPWRSRATCTRDSANNLDSLCKRYGIDNSHRELHGALLDARIWPTSIWR